jgi:1-aminocyclopropane-1-carboxylate deaminase
MNDNFIEGIVKVNELKALRGFKPAFIQRWKLLFTMLTLNSSPQFNEWHCDEFTANNVTVVVCRLDQMDKQIPGNKIYKLLENINVATELGFGTILSFGGMWSNHLHALAQAGKRYGFNTVGMVRGHEGQTTPMLEDVKALGMEINFIGPSDYKHKDNSDYMTALAGQYGPFYPIPEGGANQLGVAGCQLIGAQIEKSVHADAEFVALAVGTGTTAVGLCCSLAARKTVIGAVVLKGMTGLDGDLDTLIQQQGSESHAALELDHNYHFGGYAKINIELAEFVTAFNGSNSFAIEPIYTGKAFFAVWDKIRRGKIQAGSKIVLLHTGGMQGARGTAPIVQRLLKSKRA